VTTAKKKKMPVYVGPDATCAVCEANGAKPLGKAYWDSPIRALGGSWGYLCYNDGYYRNKALATRVTTKEPAPPAPGPAPMTVGALLADRAARKAGQ
jgi:hypothetical protein